MISEGNAFGPAPWIGQRSTTYRYRVVDGATGEHRGELNPSRESTPSLSHDTTSTIPRRLQGITLLPDDAARYRPLIDRVELSMVVDGVGEYPLGRYVAADSVRSIQTDGVSGEVASTVPVSFYDEMFIVDQALDDAFASGGLLISEVIRALLAGVVDEPLIDTCSATSDAGWSAGTSRASALKDLCSAGGYFSPWFDNAGVVRCVQAFDPATRIPAFDFDATGVMRDSITVTDGSVTAPNRFVVVSNDTTEGSSPIVGTYDVPATAPNSILNRGIVIPKIIDAQVTSVEQAQVYARTVGIQEEVVTKAEVDTLPDPRHDGFDSVLFLGERWLEIGWSLPLSGTGVMRHVLSRSYRTSVE